MVICAIRQLNKNLSLWIYVLSTIFVVFFSIHAIEKWPSLWAQTTISLACMLPALVVLLGNGRDLVQKKWPVEIKFVLTIIILGILNVCFSEDRGASLKGMGLFLMSGAMIFAATFFLFNSKQAQKIFFFLYALCFVALVLFWAFEFVRNLDVPGKQISLFSSNPIPAGSLLILLSGGPLALWAQAKPGWKKNALFLCLLFGTLVICLIGKRGPLLALLVMAFIWVAIRDKRIWILPLIVLVLVGIGVQFPVKIFPQYINRVLKMDTVFVRLEYYLIARQVVKDKPLLGIGFNAPMTRYIQKDYESKLYPADRPISFYGMIGGNQTFDNMVLCFLGEAGGLFTVAYIGLVAYLLKNLLPAIKMNLNVRNEAILLLIVLAGFITHSMTFDSLKYPDLNWIFHSYLGLVANYYKST